LRHFEELSYEEIASVMKTSVGSVKIALHRARKKFKEKMEELNK
jgi:DNA-directed RNA polymerase specialized sigma24 family protein